MPTRKRRRALWPCQARHPKPHRLDGVAWAAGGKAQGFRGETGVHPVPMADEEGNAADTAVNARYVGFATMPKGASVSGG